MVMLVVVFALLPVKTKLVAAAAAAADVMCCYWSHCQWYCLTLV